MPEISQRRFLSTIRGPSAEALDILASNSAEILAAWHREIRALGLGPRHFAAGTELDFAQLADHLRHSTYPAFRRAVQKFGETLADRNVSLDHAVVALNRIFEISLPRLTQHVAKRASPVLALARLQALVGLLVVSVYTGKWATEKKTLLKASMADKSSRRYGASAYVTRIYEQERRRLSHDLHDEIGHDLILLKLHLEMISLNADNQDREPLQSRLTEAIALVSHAIDGVRRLVFDLGPAIFEDLGFLPAVRSYISQFSSQTKIDVELHEGIVPNAIPSSHQVALYRLLQGALSNVLKHASATKVTVSLTSSKHSVLIMVIEDNGVGFDIEAKPGHGSFGLIAMRERVEVLGGGIRLESKPAAHAAREHGTRIEFDLPLPGGEEKSRSA